MNRKHCPDVGQLQSFLLGRLEQEESEALAQHMLHCNACAEIAASIEGDDELTRALRDSVQVDLDQDALALLINDAVGLMSVNGPNETGVDRWHWSGENRGRVPGTDRAGGRPGGMRTPIVETDGESAVSTEPRHATGLLPEIPGFELIERIGSGGMGVVFKARQLRLNRLVALKMVHARAILRHDTLKRFRTEAETVARLEHPNIVSIFDFGEANGVPYFALEYVQGGSLDRLLASKTLPPRQAARLLATIASAIEFAHQHNIVHRDLKPANILLSGYRDAVDQVELDSPIESRPAAPDRSIGPMLTPKVSDFGLARLADNDDRQTQTGVVVGTPAYMAPEQASGDNREIGPAVDVYSLGIILYEAITGRVPFRAATTVETLRQVVDHEPVSPRALNDHVPKDLETICLKCLSKHPAQRYRTAADLAADLNRFLDGAPVLARPVGNLTRVARWCARNPGPAILSLSTAMLLVIVAVVATVSAIELSRANAVAVAARKDSEHDRRAAAESITELSSALYRDLERRPGTIKERAEFIDVALNGLQSVTQSENHHADPGIARTYVTISELHALQGNLGLAATAAEKGRVLSQRLMEKFPEQPTHAITFAEVQNWLSDLAFQTTGGESSLPHIEAAVAVLEPLLAGSPDDPRLLRNYVQAKLNLNSLYAVRQDFDSVYRESMALLPLAKRWAELEPGRASKTTLAKVTQDVSRSAMRLGFLDQADELVGVSMQSHAESTEQSPDDLIASLQYWRGLVGRALIRVQQGRIEEASHDLEVGLVGVRQLASSEPDDLDLQYQLADVLRLVAWQSHHAGDRERLKRSCYESMDVLRRMIARSPSSHLYKALFVASAADAMECAKYDLDWIELESVAQESVAYYQSLDVGQIDMGFEGSWGPWQQAVLEAAQRLLNKFQGDVTDEGTCALLLLYGYLESREGNFELSESTISEIRRTCDIDLRNQQQLHDYVDTMEGLDRDWCATRLVRRAVVFSLLAERTSDRKQKLTYVDQALSAIQRAADEFPEITEEMLPLEMDLAWLRQRPEFKARLGSLE